MREGRAQGARRAIGGSLLVFFLVTVAGCNLGGGGSSTALIAGSPTTQVQVGQSYSFAPVVHVAAATHTFSIQNKPAWASFSIATGKLSGTPSATDLGSYAGVVISVSDGAHTAALPAFTIRVVQAQGTATLAWQPPTTNTDGTPITDLAGYKINYGTNPGALNQTISVDNPSAISYTVENLAPGTWYFAISDYTTDGVQSSPSGAVSTSVQ